MSNCESNDSRSKSRTDVGSLKTPQKGQKGPTGSSNAANCASSLNNPANDQSSSPANQITSIHSNLKHNTNRNPLISSFEDSRIKSTIYKTRKETKFPRERMELQNTSVIDLDSSVDMSLTANDSFGDLIILDTSNNSTPTTQALSAESETSVTKHMCTIVNCASEFSSNARLEQHMELFTHSPCNPCLLARDCTLEQDPLCYMCPGCDIEFATLEECREHIIDKDHLTFYPPLSITAYMCSQCLQLFGTLESCWIHIEQSSHHGLYYPFADDYTTREQLNGPVALTNEFVQDFISKCKNVAYTVQCLECGMLMESAAMLKCHREETRNLHVVASLTETSLIDVFNGYIASYSCNTCHRLFSGELKELAKHQCAKRLFGTIIAEDSRSFAEFMKRCALSLIKSLEADDSPGTSRQGRRSPARVKKKRVGEAKYNAITDIDNQTSGNSTDEWMVARNKQGKCQQVRTTHWDSGNSSYETDESSFEIEIDSSKRNENKEKNKKQIEESDIISIDDIDDSRDVSGIDVPSGSGAKRKRRKKKSNKSKDKSAETSTNIPAESNTASTTPVDSDPENKSKNDSLPGSQLFVMNFKPRSSRLSTNVLTQESMSQPIQHLSADTAPSSGANQTLLQPRVPSSSKYQLRNQETNSLVETVQADDIDASNQNIAETLKQGTSVSHTTSRHGQTYLQGASANVRHGQTYLQGESANMKHGQTYLQGETSANCRTSRKADEQLEGRRDRSRSPLSSLGATWNQRSDGYNLMPQSSGYGQPATNPLLPIPDRRYSNIPTQPPAQYPVMGPSQYQLPNRGNMRSTAQMIPPAAPRVPFLTARSSSRMDGHTAGSSSRTDGHTAGSSSRTDGHTAGSIQRASNEYRHSGVGNRTVPQPLFGHASLNASSEHLITTEYLQQMKNIVFLDLDNWPSFFHKLPCCLPDLTFVWGFFGGKNPWYAPNRLGIFRQMKLKGLFYLNERCGFTKDAADFAIVLTVGKMAERLPPTIAFTIMSGDKGFCEVERLMKNAERRVMVVNPHTAAQFSNDLIYAMVTSVTDT